MRRGTIASQHYAFHVSDAEFDAFLQRVKDAGLAFGSGPRSLGKLDASNGGKRGRHAHPRVAQRHTAALTKRGTQVEARQNIFAADAAKAAGVHLVFTALHDFESWAKAQDWNTLLQAA